MDADFVNKYNQVLSRLKQVENFDGSDAAKLAPFLNKIDALMPAINSFDDYYKAQLMALIKNKCVDRARDAVFMRQLSAPAAANGHAIKPESWHKLKEQLLHSYAERESSYTLIHKLRTSVLDSNIELYYQKLAKLKLRLLNRKQTHNDTLYSLEDIERITLQVFRDHLPEPTHSMILRRNPKSMEEAYRYIVEVQQQFYTQSGPLGGEQGATFSTSHKQTFGLASGSVGMGVGLGVGLASGGFAYGKQQPGKGVASAQAGYQQYQQQAKPGKPGSGYYAAGGAGPAVVGAGKTNPMFKSAGNPTFKTNYSSSGNSSSSNKWDKAKPKDNSSSGSSKAKDYQQSGKDVKASSGWRK